MEDDTARELDLLMARLADGDRSAAPPLFSILMPVLQSFAERALGNSGDADDVAQQTIEKLFAQAIDFDSSRSALAWALSIAGWECRTVFQRRRRRKEEPLEAAANFPSHTESPEDQVVNQALLQSLQTVVDGLPPGERRELLDSFAGKNSASDAAFRKRKQRTLERVRREWRKLYGT